MCYITVTRLKTVWRARNTLVTCARRISPGRDSRRDIHVRLFFFFLAPALLAQDRVQRGDPRSGPSDDFGILHDRAIEIGFAARCVTFARASGRILKRNELVSRIGERGVIENQMGDRASIARAFERSTTPGRVIG